MNASKSNVVVALLALLAVAAFSLMRRTERGANPRAVMVIPKSAGSAATAIPISRGGGNVREPANTAVSAPASPELIRKALDRLPPHERAELQGIVASGNPKITTKLLEDPVWVAQMVQQHRPQPDPDIPDIASIENPYERLRREGLTERQEVYTGNPDDNNPYQRLLEQGQGESAASR